LRLTINNKRIELATHQYISSNLWDTKGQFVRGKTEEAKTINQHLTIMKSDLHRHYTFLLALNKPITPVTLKNAYFGKWIEKDREKTNSHSDLLKWHFM